MTPSPTVGHRPPVRYSHCPDIYRASLLDSDSLYKLRKSSAIRTFGQRRPNPGDAVGAFYGQRNIGPTHKALKCQAKVTAPVHSNHQGEFTSGTCRIAPKCILQYIIESVRIRISVVRSKRQRGPLLTKPSGFPFFIRCRR